MNDRWLTYPEAARRARVSMRQVRRWRAAGLEGRVGEHGRWEVEETKLMEHARWYRARRVRWSTAVQPRRTRDTPTS